MTKKPVGRVGRPKGTGAQRIHDAVRDSILNLEMRPGSDIDEKSLVEKFGVSRTPVREALIQLASEGLVELRSNRGARVAALDLNEVPELLEGLELCMHITNRWAAIRRGDDEIDIMRTHAAEYAEAAKARDFERMSKSNNFFHVAIARASRNRYLVSMHRSLMPGCLRLTHIVLMASPRLDEKYEAYCNRVIDEHDRMVEAIARRDPEAAAKAARDHAELTRSRVLRFIQLNLATTTPIDDPKTLDGMLPQSAEQGPRRSGRGKTLKVDSIDT